MYRLPLFPLNTVLFPKMSLSLHIFEERYKRMIRRCIEQNEPFGIVLIESGSEVQTFGEKTIPYRTGCTARITQVQELTLGRMNISVVGEQRFAIIGFEYDEPYLIGRVENLNLSRSSAHQIRVAGSRLQVWVERYLSVLERTERIQFDRTQIPADDIDLGYLAASLLKISMSEKQALLAENEPVAFLMTLNRYFRKEATILNLLSASSEHRELLPFSLN